MRKTLGCGAAFLLICCCALTAGAQGKRYLRAIEILPGGALGDGRADPLSPKRFVELMGRKAAVDLEVGEVIEGRDVVLHLRPGVTGEFKIEQRIETSLTVSAEGPHLDLREWKHHYSEWMALDETGENRFRIREVSEEDETRFPDVSPEEIRQAVWSAGGEKWAELVKDVKGPHDAPAAVGLSKITLRVSMKDGGGWKVINVIDLLVAMGC